MSGAMNVLAAAMANAAAAAEADLEAAAESARENIKRKRALREALGSYESATGKSGPPASDIMEILRSLGLQLRNNDRATVMTTLVAALQKLNEDSAKAEFEIQTAASKHAQARSQVDRLLRANQPTNKVVSQHLR